LGKPKSFQVEEDKILAEVTFSTIYRRIPLIWKGVEEGSRCSTRSFQSKETSLGLGGSILRESGMLPCSEGTGLEMLMTWSKDASLLKIGVVLAEDCIDMTVVSIKEGLGCWETKDDSEPEGLSDKDLCFLYHDSSRAQTSKVIPFANPTKELGLTSYTSRLLNRMNSPNMTYSGW
jgi:hypothetical protein